MEQVQVDLESSDHVLPSGRRLEGVGVVPDVIVPLDEQAVDTYRAGADAELEWIGSERRRAGGKPAVAAVV